MHHVVFVVIFKVKHNRKKPWISQTRYKTSGSQVDYDRHRTYSNQLKNKLRLARNRYEQRLLKTGANAVYKFVRSKMLSKVSSELYTKATAYALRRNKSPVTY